jgi:hypothetical protein
LACALGCEGAGGAASTSGPSDEDATGGSTTTDEGTGSSTFGDAVPCSATRECETGVCVAPYDPGAGTGVAGMGMAVCVPACVAEDALDLWCIDDASCCEGLECNAIDGFCDGPSGTSSDSTIGETWVVDSSSEDASSSETSSGSSSDTGASSSSTSSD